MQKQIYVDGIKVLYHKNKQNKGTFCEMGIQCGGFCDDIAGEAHFLEHLFFSKTKTKDHETLEKETRMHHFGAYTNYDEIELTFEDSSSQIEKCFELASDMLFGSVLDDTFVESERKVINNEIAQRMTPPTELMLSHNAQIFQEQKLAILVGGTKESLALLTAETLKEFQNKWFFKENFQISISSNKSLSQIKKLVKKYIASNLASKKLKPQKIYDLTISAPSFLNVLKKVDVKNSRVLLNVCLQQRPRKTWDKVRFVQLQRYINSMLYDRLFKRVREQKSFVYSIAQNSVATKTQKAWGLKFETENSTLIPCINEVSETLKDALQTGFSQEEFDRYVTRVKLEEDLDLIHPRSEMHSMQEQIYVYGTLLNEKAFKKMFFTYTLNDVNKFFKNHFKPNCVYLSILTNAEDKQIPTLEKVTEMFLEKQKE